MLFLHYPYKGVDKTPVKKVSPRSATMKNANVEGTTSNKRQKIEDTSSDLAKVVLILEIFLAKLKLQKWQHKQALKIKN
jgi:hypothetical protein